MKKVLIALAILAFAAPLFAGDGYVAIYVDEGHTKCEVYYPQPSADRYLYVFWLVPQGLKATEYMLELSDIDNLELGSVTHNPDSNLQMGAPETGMVTAFETCWTDWVWSQKIRFYVYEADPMWIYLRAYPGADHDAADCNFNNPQLVHCNILNHLAVNQPCVVGNEESSWGAIKSLF